MALLIFFTPIKRYLPGFEDASVREVVTNELMRVDSLQSALDVQNEYITVMRSLLSGEIQADSITSIDSLTLIQRERISLEKSQAEQEFCAKVEEKDLFNLTQSTAVTSQYVFFRPVRGVISASFDPLNNQFGIVLATAPDEIVMSVLSGTVVSTEFTLEKAKELFELGVTLEFLKEPHINTDTYRKALTVDIKMTGTNADILLKAVKEYLMELAKEQIKIAFNQAEKEVQDLHVRTSEGIKTAKLNGKQIGRIKGKTYTSQKEKISKEIILKNSRDFNGTNTDEEVMKICGISRNSYYKYKRELKNNI